MRLRIWGTLLVSLAWAGGGLAQEEGRISGPVCGASDILGEALAPIEGPDGCGVAEPVRVEAVAGVTLEPAPELDCETAAALKRWVTEAAQPAFTEAGERLAGLRIAAGYVCRNTNRAEEGDLSEHAFGRALDVSAFMLEGGDSVTLHEHWDDPALGPLLRRLYAAACGPFTTTLGPEANALHADHFHFDLATRRNAYCP